MSGKNDDIIVQCLMQNRIAESLKQLKDVR
jgi:hypothetical protein